jgi:hypothetical protein
MTWVAVGAGAVALIGGVNANNQADSAADRVERAGDSALGESQRQFDTVRADTRIARNTADSALLTLGILLGTRKPATPERIATLESDLAAAMKKRKRAIASNRATAQADRDNKPSSRDRLGNAARNFGSSGDPTHAIMGYEEGGKRSGRIDVRAIDKDISRIKSNLSLARRTAGIGKQYAGGLGDFVKAQPGYQFGLDEGTNAVTNTLSAGGQGQGGKAMKALQRYGQDYAGTKVDSHLNRLFTLAGYGAPAVNTSAAAGQNVASTVGNVAGMNADVAFGQAGNNIAGVNNALNTGLSLWQYNQMNRRPPATTPTLGSAASVPQGNTPSYIGGVA